MGENKKFSVSGELLFTVLENTPFGIMAFSPQGNIQWVNIQALRFLDIEKTEKEVINCQVLETIHRPIELKDLLVKEMLMHSRPFDLEGIFYQNRYLTFRGRITKKGMILTIADITSIKMSEFLSLNSMLEGQEIERKRLSREIHDGIGPLLSTLKMNLATIEDDLVKDDKTLIKKLMNSYELIDEISDDLRAISHNLLPKVLHDFGLLEALETLGDKISTTKNISVSFLHTGIGTRLDHMMELGLYRICQELINNTLKHGKAKKITLQLIRVSDMLRVIYEDDGLGFSMDKIKQGLGIMNIENRVRAFGGELNLDSVPGKGMTATIEIPLTWNQ